MTQLRICDLDGSDDDSPPPLSPTSRRLDTLRVEGSDVFVTAKDVSPDGHVAKRRARHRLALDWLDSPSFKAVSHMYAMISMIDNYIRHKRLKRVSLTMDLHNQHLIHLLIFSNPPHLVFHPQLSHSSNHAPP
jgi:hypothetical protein